jgi:hypothetical protein
MSNFVTMVKKVSPVTIDTARKIEEANQTRSVTKDLLYLIQENTALGSLEKPRFVSISKKHKDVMCDHKFVLNGKE